MILFNYYYYLLGMETATPYTPFRLAPAIPFTLMKDLAAIEVAVGLGAKVYEEEISFWGYAELNSFSLWMASEVLADSPVDILYLIASMPGSNPCGGFDYMATPTFFLNYHP